jgi:hypothetical protein
MIDPITAVAEALAALNAVLNVINALRGQGGLTDDQILAQAQTTVNANDQFYQTVVTALKPAPPPAPPAVAPAG